MGWTEGLLELTEQPSNGLNRTQERTARLYSPLCILERALSTRFAKSGTSIGKIIFGHFFVWENE
jgi:hypothetical protein